MGFVVPSGFQSDVITPYTHNWSGCMTREVCWRGPDGKMYCARSPIRDCGCPPEEGFEDPFPDLPEKIDLSTATAYLAQLLRMGAASGATAE